MKKNYQEFKKELFKNVEMLLEKRGKNEKASIITNEKQNGTLEGVQILKEVSNDIKVGPIYYFQHMYRDYLELNMTIPELIENMHLDEIEGKVKMINGILGSKVLPDIMPVLINANSHKDYLQDKITRPFLDLEIMYRGIIYSDEDNSIIGTVPFDENVAKHYGVDEKTLYEKGLDYLEKNTILKNFMGMTLLTTNDNEYGSASLVSKRILSKVAKKLGVDSFYILPSSIQEVIIVEKEANDKEVQLNSLKNTVNSINNNPNIMNKDMILSYNVYSYDAIKDELKIA